ncbi:MAG: acyl-CoA dehydrogenase family protein [Acidobacteriota bacterium]|nr:acyl-CoA dehydrogenase family protein [Acidobacteriota bacterium]
MSYALTEEQLLIGQSARDFAKECLDPIAAELDHSAVYPAEMVKKLAKYDLLSLFLAGEYGGAEAGFVAFVEALEALARSSAAVANIVLNHSIAAWAIEHWGSPEQKQKYLGDLATGEKLGALAFYENGPLPGVGSDALVAKKQEEGWVLNGVKAYVRNAGVAGVYVVLATTDPESQGKALTAFLVDAAATGLKVGEAKETMGLRGCPVAELSFENVILAESAVLGSLDAGTKLAAETLAVYSLGEAALTVGIGQAALEHAAAYSKTRVQFGRPISALHAIQTMLAETATDTHVARIALRDAAQLFEEGKPFAVEAAMVKQFLARFGSKMLLDTCQVEGGFGYSEFMPLPRLFRDIAGTTLLEAPAEFPDKTIAAALLA